MRADTSEAVYALGMKGSNRLLRLTAACFLLQALIPVGFMPGNLAHGEFATLCPSGLPDAMVVEFFGEHHAHHSDSPEYAQCDFASGAVNGAIPEPAPAATPVAATTSTPITHNTVRSPQRVYRPANPRAPPHSAEVHQAI